MITDIRKGHTSADFIPAPGELGSLSSQIRPVAGLPLVYVD